MDNRDISVLFWLTLFAAYCLRDEKVRASLKPLLRTLFGIKIFPAIAVLGVYIWAEVCLVKAIGLWPKDFYVALSYWIAFSAFGLFLDLNSISSDAGRFTKIAKDQLTLVILLEFIVNVYSFSLWVELLIVPIVAVLSGCAIISQGKEEYNYAYKFFNFALGCFGVAFLSSFVLHIKTDFYSFANPETLKKLLAPPTLTVMLFPYLYFLALFIRYERIFTILKFKIKDPNRLSKIKRRLLIAFHLRIDLLNKWDRSSKPLLLHDDAQFEESIRVTKDRNVIGSRLQSEDIE